MTKARTPFTPALIALTALTALTALLTLPMDAVAQGAPGTPNTPSAPAAVIPTTAISATAMADDEPAPKLAPVLGLLLGKVLEASFEAATGDTPLGLFRRLARQVAQGDAAGASMVTLSPAGGNGKTAGGLTPALGYAMEQLDPGSFAVLRPLPVAGSGALLRTGDVFALQFSTNLPGQVRLENTDPLGKVSDLGTYTVLVDQLNRIPRDKGIQLQGQPGLEQLRFYFFPCLPPEAEGRTWANEFRNVLPPCGSSPVWQTAQASSYGAVVPRALVNLTQPDATMVFAGASDYRAGEVTMMEARLRHEKPAAARPRPAVRTDPARNGPGDGG